MDSLYNRVYEYPLKIFSIFTEFFGEENVDFQPDISEDELESFIDTEEIGSFALTCLSQEEYDIIKDTYTELSDIYKDFPDIAVKILRENARAYIIVRFPEVTITNEYDASITVKNLYTRIKVTGKGTLAERFGVIKSDFSKEEFCSMYIHSHVTRLNYNNVAEFKKPCLGNGPLSNTTRTLSIEFDESIWMLFCLELQKWVRVESLVGGPYTYIRSIGKDSYTLLGLTYTYNTKCPYALEKDMPSVIKYLLDNNVLTYNFAGGSYGLAGSYRDYLIKVSNAFIDWFNTCPHEVTLSQLLNEELLIKVYLNNDRALCTSTLYSHSLKISECEGRELFTFKGSPVHFHVNMKDVKRDEGFYVICNSLFSYIVDNIIRVLNYEYKK